MQVAAFMTESDHAPGRETDGNYSRHIVGDVADQFLQSWATWEWKNFFRGDNIPPSQLASNWGAHVTGNAPAWPLAPPGHDPQPLPFFQKAYARTYAPAIAGEANSMFFNVSNGDFRLEYIVTKTDLRIATEIFVSHLWYPEGIRAVATASNGRMRVEQQWHGNLSNLYKKSGRVLVFPRATVTKGSTVVVEITTVRSGGRNPFELR
eukprot:SAG31_NODE_4648_length_3069_cov_1.952525_1_plen_207_part_00